jgi:hypothetical protein
MLLEQFIAGLGSSCRKAHHLLKSKGDGKFVNWKVQHDPLTLKYLVQHAWGCNNSYLCELRKQQKQQRAESKGSLDNGGFETLLLLAPPPLTADDESNSVPETVIDNYEIAEKKYMASYLYAIHKCRMEAKNLDSVDKKLYTERFNAAFTKFDSLDVGTKALWEGKRRVHLFQQPAIKNQIIDTIRKNPKRSWKVIKADINFWCSDSAIYRWITSKPGYHLYCERVIPLLMDAQRLKHFTFAKHFHNNWGLGAGKYLLIEYDEKWFWGLAMRRGAKSCEDLGGINHSHTQPITRAIVQRRWASHSLRLHLRTILRMVAMLSSLDSFMRNHSKWHKRR